MIATRFLAAAGASAALLVAAPVLAETTGHAATPHRAATEHHGGAQSAPQSHDGGRPSHMRGTASHHPTPKRQHVMEQQVRAHGGSDREAAQVDQLNEMSLQRAQGAAAPASTPAAPR